MRTKERLFIGIQYLTPQHAFSRLVGILIRVRVKWILTPLLKWYIRRYGVDMSLAVESNPAQYASFNSFFTRALKPEARPLCQDPQKIMCPVDGAISQIGPIENGNIFQAKGTSFTAEQLLADTASASNFNNGIFTTLYLSPRDYHRIHMPVAGSLRKMIHVPGCLFSVNPTTVAAVPGLFAKNERVVCIFVCEDGSELAMVLVGAMIVASIATSWAGLITPPTSKQITVRDYQPGEVELDMGDELGHFELGSTVVMLFSNQHYQWLPEFQAQSQVVMGQALGMITA